MTLAHKSATDFGIYGLSIAARAASNVHGAEFTSPHIERQSMDTCFPQGLHGPRSQPISVI